MRFLFDLSAMYVI